jgi:hypothetical protein
VHERLGLIVPTEDGIGSRQNTCPGIERRIDARLGNGYGLLLHSLMNGDLVLSIHLIKLIDTTDPVIGQHQGPCLNAHLPILIPRDRRSQTGSARRLATRVDASGHELLDRFQELGLGCGGVADYQYVQVATDVQSGLGGFVHA